MEGLVTILACPPCKLRKRKAPLTYSHNSDHLECPRCDFRVARTELLEGRFGTAFADLGRVRCMGKVVKRNKKTTIIDFDPQYHTREQELYHMHNGISLQSHKEDLEKQGLTKPGRVKRHNKKHNVVFI